MHSYWYICQMQKSWERPFIKRFHGFLDSSTLPCVFENGKLHGVYEAGKEDGTEIILLVTVVQYDFLTEGACRPEGKIRDTGILLNWCQCKRGVWQAEVKRLLASVSKNQKVRVSCSNITVLTMAACFENFVNRI